jgi:hypothetical protein
MSYDNFVLPFSIGTLFLIFFLSYKFIFWIRKFPSSDKQKIKFGFFSFKTLKAIKEIILESLFHRRIFRVNPLLGYMHCTLALGWFLLIVFGNVESRIHAGTKINLPYYPIFFKFFEHKSIFLRRDSSTRFFTFIMDFILM